MWGVRLTLAFLLAPRLGLVGVWAAMCIELCIRGALFLIRLARGKWLDGRTRVALGGDLPPFFLNAWVFSTTALMPDFNRMNPLSGIGRMFSWNSLMELGKASLKAILIGGVAVWLIWKERDEIFGLLGQPLEAALAYSGHLLSYSFLIMVAALILIVAADVPFQLWSALRKCRIQ